MRLLASRMAVATTVLATCATTGSAQGTREIEVRVLGGAMRVDPPMRTVSDLRGMMNTNRNQTVTPAPIATSGALRSPSAPAPSEHYGWTATGFIGSYFAAGGDASGANDINASVTYGGALNRMWGVVGAEILADFAPKYKIESLLLSEHPGVNSYMANVIARWGMRFQDHFQPYVSGGIGGIQMQASFLPVTTPTGATDNTKVEQTRVGWNIGAGGYAFAGRTIGLRADVRYFKATTTDTFTGTFQQNATEALLSGIDFWRANIGVAFRW